MAVSWQESLRSLLHSEKEARQKHVATVEERLERLETSLGETHSKHALEIESTKAAHQRLSKEQKLRDEKHASVQERLEYLETKIGDSFDQHERELKAAHAKLEQAQNRILQCEKQGATISELHRSHSTTSQEHKAALAAHTASLGERLEFLEKSLGQSVEKHAKEVEALKVSHSKFATDTKLRDTHHATVSERLDYVEKMVGDSADKHAKELAAAHDKIKDMHKRVTDCEAGSSRSTHKSILACTYRNTTICIHCVPIHICAYLHRVYLYLSIYLSIYLYIYIIDSICIYIRVCIHIYIYIHIYICRYRDRYRSCKLNFNFPVRLVATTWIS